MKVKVEGTILEKFSRKAKNFDGVEVERLFIRLYQIGERVNLDVNVKPSTYSQLEVGQTVELADIKISSFKDFLYARQE
ncbi:MAG: hypothetical protein M0Q14_01845 [Tissierellaceae bacterium]|nr:hypothetical protein [Tissierellaceae bacterium]